MKRYLIPFLFIPISAFGQVDPFQAFINQYSAANVAHENAIAAATPAIQAYQKLIKQIGDDEARIQTLIEWLKQAQAKEVK